MNNQLPSLLIMSDLHFEWDKATTDYSKLINKKVADIAVLAGDIAGGTYGIHFVRHLISLGYKVLYVLGNHEFYGYKIQDVINEWIVLEDETDGLYLLDNSSVTIDGVEFFGSTFWSSLGTSSNDMVIDYFIRQKIKGNTDFRLIEDLTPETMAVIHHESAHKLFKLIENSEAEKKVVITHYLPSEKSVHERFIGQHATNLMFFTEYGQYISYSDINLWIHGHTHDMMDYNIHQTRVICYPRGYVDANMANPDFKWLGKIITEY